MGKAHDGSVEKTNGAQSANLTEASRASDKALSELQPLAMLGRTDSPEMKVQLNHRKSWLGFGDTDIWESGDITFVDQESGEAVLLPGSFTMERNGDEQHINVEFVDLNLDIYANRASQSVKIKINDQSQFSSDAKGNLELETPERSVQIKDSGFYSEKRADGTQVTVSEFGVVTRTDKDGYAEHFRLHADGVTGAKLQSLRLDPKDGKLLADFSGGTVRTIIADANSRLSSSWTEEIKDAGGAVVKQKEHYEALNTDAFSREHLLTRATLARLVAAPLAINRDEMFKWPEPPEE